MLLGLKGACLCEMTQMGLNVPPGFVITTKACLAYLESTDGSFFSDLMDEIKQQMKFIEQMTGKAFGDPQNPLLVSVRPGAAISLPGLSDTILNLGLNEATLRGLISQNGNEQFAYDAYQRFLQLFGKAAMGVSEGHFEQVLDALKVRNEVTFDLELTTEDLKEVCLLFHQLFEEETPMKFPEDVWEQLAVAVRAIFESWMSQRATDYRRKFNITKDQANGVACTIMAMVFGNMDDNSGTGVGFTRDPGTGENQMFGEYLIHAQGEDVVAGVRTPAPIELLATEMPSIYHQLEDLKDNLERLYREIRDFEFTVESGSLYCLQSQNGRMNAEAMVRTSVDLVEEGLITKEEALLRIDPKHLEQLVYPRLDPSFFGHPIAQGFPASPGAVAGYCAFDVERAETWGKVGESVILVQEETGPEDIHGFLASKGVVTSKGQKTCHAAVVARSMGKPCVVGADEISVDTNGRQAQVGPRVLHEGDIITIDGIDGNVYYGQIDTIEPEFNPYLITLLKWADEVAQLTVYANADTPWDAVRARSQGAAGIGLCRTERMFEGPDRLPLVIELLLARTPAERIEPLDQILNIQRSDFRNILRTMGSLSVTFRLLDTPLHEFLPSVTELSKQVEDLKNLRGTVIATQSILGNVVYNVPEEEASKMAFAQLDSELILGIIQQKEMMLKKTHVRAEANPMLGHRGVRLGITMPDIYVTQIRAILEAAADCISEGIDVQLGIIVPMICAVPELTRIKAYLDELRKEIQAEKGVDLKCKLGAMMEVVSACLKADELATVAEFFAFGTNDLTQATLSFSRDDAENKFLAYYLMDGLIDKNPFESLDFETVGLLIKMAVEKGRKIRPGIPIGICGEQASDPTSIKFFDQLGLDYVSCSVPQLPIARLAAAQASILNMANSPTLSPERRGD